LSLHRNAPTSPKTPASKPDKRSGSGVVSAVQPVLRLVPIAEPVDSEVMQVGRHLCDAAFQLLVVLDQPFLDRVVLARASTCAAESPALNDLPASTATIGAPVGIPMTESTDFS